MTHQPSSSSTYTATRSDEDVVTPDFTKLEALAEFAAGAGHEINNPLATIIGRAQQLLKDERDPQRRQMLLAIGAQAYRIRDMIGDAMLFGRPPTPELTTVDLGSALTALITKQADELTTDRCSVRIEITHRIYLHADPTQFNVVVSELLRNGRQALQPGGGEIVVRALTENNLARIQFEDHGKGFSESEREHAFDPFYSGRQAGRGLGFGLSKSWRIVTQHSGDIQIFSPCGGPTTVEVRWPLAPEPVCEA